MNKTISSITLTKVTKFLAVTGLLALVGCAAPIVITSAPTSGPVLGSVSDATLVPKDYETVGIVFVESTETHTRSSSTTETSGSKITYEMLLKEAEKLEADDIINLRMDLRVSTERVRVAATTKHITNYHYTASALAIRYKDVVERRQMIGNAPAVNHPSAKAPSAGSPAAAPQPANTPPAANQPSDGSSQANQW